MVVLKKVTASSLMETLVATVLIVIIFMVSSMVLNNIITSNIKNNTDVLDTRLTKLEYQYRNGAFELPYQEDFDDWYISFSKDLVENREIVFVEAMHAKSEVMITKSITRED